VGPLGDEILKARLVAFYREGRIVLRHVIGRRDVDPFPILGVCIAAASRRPRSGHCLGAGPAKGDADRTRIVAAVAALPFVTDVTGIVDRDDCRKVDCLGEYARDVGLVCGRLRANNRKGDQDLAYRCFPFFDFMSAFFRFSATRNLTILRINLSGNGLAIGNCTEPFALS
jgi:hypothetical protein